MTGWPPAAACARWLPVVTVALLAGDRLAAQEAEREPARPRRWSGSAAANGSVLFGNTDQRVLGGRAALTRADSVLELDAGLQALYGDASREDGSRQLTKRLWIGTLTLDYRPAARTSPFVFTTLESNLEKQLARRHSVGVGAKQTFVRTARSEASLSLALLDERTVPRRSAPDATPTRLTRWSTRARVRHAFDERLRVSLVTFWQPSARTPSRFLLRTTAEAEYAVTGAIGLSVSLLDNYDSEAVRRGARVNRDGQLLFGIGARW